MNKDFWGTAVLLAAFLSMMALCGCDDVSTELNTPVYTTGLSKQELSSSAFKKPFPSQYASYQKNNESEVMTEYKGSVAYHKNDNVNPLPTGFKKAQPYLKNLWLGYPFMYEYNEPRGHTHAVEDFVNIDRLDSYDPSGKGNMPATCWNCKTPRMMEWIATYGNAFWTKDVNEFRPKNKINMMDDSISCATCHDPATMVLRPYSEPLKDWLKRSGQDWDKLSRNEKRTLVCAQCHVEYYFTAKGNGPTLRPVFPWDLGKTPEAFYEYYKTHGPKDANGKEKPFTDFVHAASKVNVIKMQHPDYETFQDGPHGAAGVSCADCHMQYMREGGKKVSSHWMTSPMKDKEMRACRQCHADKTAEYLRSRVHYIQEKTFNKLLEAEAHSVKAHEAIRLANEWTGEKAENYAALINEAKEMARKGQLFWDYVSAENSIGFHNPTKQLNALMTSYEASQKAIDLAAQATKFGISASLTGDIKNIVPPILYMSRKLQQDPEFLQKHPWTKYLPVKPKNEQVWKGQEWVGPKNAHGAPKM